MSRDTVTEAEAGARRHLQRRLLEQLDRTFTTEGREGVLRVMADVLARLDSDALRGYAYERGIRSEDELEGDEASRGQSGAKA